MMLTFHVFSAIFYCMFHICICNSLVIHLEYINVALHLQNRNEKSCYLCIINVYIPYTYKNDSIYGSVMNIFGCVMRMRILDNHVLKMEASFSEEEPTTSTSTSITATRASTPTTSDDVESSYNLVKKPHTISLAWKYYSVKANDKGVPIESELDGPICNLCHKRVLAKRSNTTNLFSHLQKHHPKEYNCNCNNCNKSLYDI